MEHRLYNCRCLSKVPACRDTYPGTQDVKTPPPTVETGGDKTDTLTSYEYNAKFEYAGTNDARETESLPLFCVAAAVAPLLEVNKTASPQPVPVLRHVDDD